jgi:hypothetical protein
MAGTWQSQTGASQSSTFAVSGITTSDIILSALAGVDSGQPIVLGANDILIVSDGYCQTPNLDTSSLRVLINWESQPATDLPTQPWASLPNPLTPATLATYMDKGQTGSVSGTLSSSQLQNFIDTASSRLETECNRFIVARTLTITVPAIWHQQFCEIRCYRAKAFPIQNISSVKLLSPYGEVYTIPERVGAFPSYGWWRRADKDAVGIFMCDTPNSLTPTPYDRDDFSWVVAGTFGFDPVINQREMSDLAEAIKLWATDTWALRIPSTTAVHADGQSMSFSPSKIPIKVQAIIDKYRMIVAV